MFLALAIFGHVTVIACSNIPESKSGKESKEGQINQTKIANLLEATKGNNKRLQK